MEPPRTKNRLLLVDGDPKSLRVLDVSLKKAGFEVTTATSGLEALSSLEADLPELIISDTDLREMDGFELCNRVKANPDWAKIPFLFVSGRKSIEDKIRGLELGVDDYLTKPIYIKEIGIRVRTALQRAERERMESRREGRTRFAGSLADVGVVDLVQTIELNRKSGIIHISNRDDRRGSIFFREGKVIDAETGRLSGPHALYRLFSWSEGQFAVEFKHIRRQDVVDMSMAALLMEGMRRLDESTHLLENLPPPTNVLEVDCRVLAEELAELPDEMNSVLRLCDGARTLHEVVEDSDHPDLETLTLISKLFLGQIIFAREAPEQGSEAQPSVRLAHWLSEGGADPTTMESIAPSSLNDTFSDDSAAQSSRSRVPSPPVQGLLTAEETLGAALPLHAETADGDAAIFSGAAETLKGVPLDPIFVEQAAPIPFAPTPASNRSAADAASPPSQQQSSTRPMGLAERLLSTDSVLRTAALHEAISNEDGTVREPQSPERNTHSYGDPAAQAASALVQEVVSSTHASTTHAPVPIEPERPAKEVDWGAWPALATSPSAVTATGRVSANAGVADPILSPLPASKASSDELDATALQEAEPSESPRPSADPEAANPALAQPSASGTNDKPEEATIPLGPEDVLSTEPEARNEEAKAPTDPAGAASVQASAGTPAATLVLVPNPSSQRAHPDAQAALSSLSRASVSPPTPRSREIPEPPPAWRLWFLVVAAFALGMVGYLAFDRSASVPPEPVVPLTPEPPPPPFPRGAPAAPQLPPPPAPSSPETSPQPNPRTPRPPQDEPGEIPPSAQTPTAQPRNAVPSPIVDPQSPPVASELRLRCLDTDAGGKGKAKAVLVACRPALEVDPKDAEVMVILARAEIERGRLVEARSLARKALAADSQRFEAYVYLGTAEQAAGRIDEARAAYKKYLELAPDGPFARELRAIIGNL